jgi:hypothetical protein
MGMRYPVNLIYKGTIEALYYPVFAKHCDTQRHIFLGLEKLVKRSGYHTKQLFP